jgi:hypothetical protein
MSRGGKEKGKGTDNGGKNTSKSPSAGSSFRENMKLFRKKYMLK